MTHITTYTGLHDKTNLKYLEIKTRSTNEKSTNTMDEHRVVRGNTSFICNRIKIVYMRVYYESRK
jgi:hypothetical protein